MRFMTLVAALTGLLLMPGSAQAQAETVTVNLAAQNNSGVNGTAVLTQRGSDLEVVLRLDGTKAGSDHPFHIHTGKCPSPGGVAHPLTNAVNGASTTTLANVTLASVRDGNHAINGHESSTNMSAYITCGDIAMAAAAQPTAMTSSTTAQATAVMPAAMPKTGGGSMAPSAQLPWLTLLTLLGLVGVGAGLVLARRAVS